MKIVDQKTAKRTKLHTITCLQCKEVFGTYRNTRKFCSKVCVHKYQETSKLNGEMRSCIRCGKEFYAKKSEDRRGCVRSYCSMVCTKKDPTIPLGRYISYDGYWIVRGEKREHRVVYEAAYGPIPEGHIVHHKNGDKLDNRLENLECMSRTEHNHEHMGYSSSEIRRETKRRSALKIKQKKHGEKT